MKQIKENAYRVVGILAGTSARELQKQKSKISAYSKAGREINSDYDFYILGAKPKRDEASLSRAFSEIEQNKDKVQQALFWFVNVSPIDATALEHLKAGNDSKAKEIWEKVTEGRELNEKHYSALNNRGTLLLLESDKASIKRGLNLKCRLIMSDYFEPFVHHVADETYTIDRGTELHRFIDTILSNLSKSLSVKELLGYFADCGDEAKAYVRKKFTEAPAQSIEQAVSKAKEERKQNKAKAYNNAVGLYNDTREALATLKDLLGADNLQYKMLADKVAKELKQSSVDYYNWSDDNDSTSDYLEQAMKLLKMALPIACSPLVIDEIKDNISTLEEMKDKELNQAILVLQFIKKAYEKTLLSYNQSLNWDRVIEAIKEGIPQSSINQIKVSKSNRLSEYKSLVDYVLDRIPTQKLFKVSYIRYWDNTSSNSTARPISRTGTNNTTSTNSSNNSSSSKDEETSFSSCLLAILALPFIIIVEILRQLLPLLLTGIVILICMGIVNLILWIFN